LTAYAGLYRTVQASNETVKTLVVNAAAGATGSTVIQLARNDLGIERIVAIAGSEEKCEFLRNVLKVDVALNYNDPEFKQKLIDATPNYIDL
jgi:NADPH-dependent curcumin reductase CurA